VQLVKPQTPAFDASTWKIGIVVAQFNQQITDQLYDAAIQRASDYGIRPENITTLRVAGAVELPLALQQLARVGGYQALLAIGCVIDGQTPHFEYVCKFATEGILRVQLDHNLPIGFGVLTCRTLEQARARAHLGGEHLDAAMSLAKSLAHLPLSKQ
jgi:6,7-dimethyl-8-ribityllumazine synthase